MSEHSHRMSSLDTAFLHMEAPHNPMTITGLLHLSRRMSMEQVHGIVSERLVETYPRFRQRVVESAVPGAPPHWEDDAAFDLDAHLFHVALPAPNDKATLQDFVGELMSTALPMGRPLWQFHVVDGPGEGTTLVTRIHHCIADGISLARVLISMTDEGEPLPEPSAPTPEPLSFDRVVDRVRRFARAGGESVAAAAKLLTLPDDTESALRGPLGERKVAAWSQPIPLSQIKAIGRPLGATINDVLLTAMTGALRRYLDGVQSHVEEIRVFVPVNLRPLDKPVPETLGNDLSLTLLDLPVGLVDPAERMAELKRRMDEIKHGKEPVVAWAVLNLIGMTPRPVEKVVIEHFTRKASAVMTNVPGPREPMHLDEHRIDTVMFWVPQTSEVGLGVSIFSYAGDVVVGVTADARRVPEPGAIVRAFEDEVAALYQPQP